MEPRLIRFKDAYRYLGVCREYFNRLIRPRLLEIRQGRALLFDRQDLDRIVDQWKDEERYGRSDNSIGGSQCQRTKQEYVDSGAGEESGTSRSTSRSEEEKAFYSTSQQVRRN